MEKLLASLSESELFVIVFILALFFFIASPLLLSIRYNNKRDERRLVLSQLRLTDKQRQELIKDVRLLERLPHELLEELEGLIHIFNAEKIYTPKDDLTEVTPHMKRVIAAQACLLLLGRKGDYYGKLRDIHLYPDLFKVTENGETRELAGQSLWNSQMKLAWPTVLTSGNTEDGYNLVIQQFTYLIDRRQGKLDGTPILNSWNDTKLWNDVMQSAYNEMSDKVRDDKRITMDTAGVSDRVKFFAYSTVIFYEKPEQLRNENSDLYKLLSDFYKVSPIDWLYKRREKLTKLRLNDHQRENLIKDFQLFKHLPYGLQQELEGLIHVFNDEKEYKADDGLEEITPHMKLVIAAQACLLILNRDHDMYGKLHTIYVRPDDYTIMKEGKEFQSSGESSHSGYIVLSWNSTLSGGRNPRDGHNVVLHESVHQLDLENGSTDGLPRIDCKQNYRRWIDTMKPAFENFSSAVKQKKPSAHDYYGATSLVEFFAVSSETFYEKPAELMDEDLKLYELLSEFYGVNPVEWLS